MATKSKPYASGTGVPIERSRAEMETQLKKYGATSFMYGNQGDESAVGFQLKGRHYRLLLKFPTLESFQSGKTSLQAQLAYEQEQRRLWRALVLIVKAKLVAIDAGVTTVEKEFLGDTVLPNNETVFEYMEPQVQQAYETGQVPPVLPWLTHTSKPKRLRSGEPPIEGQVREV